MQGKYSAAAVREGDTIENDWSQASYDMWCRKTAQTAVPVPGLKVVDIYAVVRSVIENDLTPIEREMTLLHSYDGLSVQKIARRTGTSTSNVYNTLNRGEEKIKLVLKHLIGFDDYAAENDDE